MKIKWGHGCEAQCLAHRKCSINISPNIPHPPWRVRSFISYQRNHWAQGIAVNELRKRYVGISWSPHPNCSSVQKLIFSRHSGLEEGFFGQITLYFWGLQFLFSMVVLGRMTSRSPPALPVWNSRLMWEDRETVERKASRLGNELDWRLSCII